MQCVRCQVDTQVNGDGLCARCRLDTEGEIEWGLSKIDQFLARHAKFDEWLADHERERECI